MKLIISDINKECFCIGEDTQWIEDKHTIRHCMGCFHCWIKTPGKCVIVDDYAEMGAYLGHCHELVIVSECKYGSLSPFVKNVIDRSISYTHPNFCFRNGEMHHKRRYTNKITMSAYFYGKNISEREKACACKIIAANAVNFDADVDQVVFLNSKEALRGMEL